MGRARRPRPARLAEKLLRLRQLMGLSQSQMLGRLSVVDFKLHAPHISEYESGKREPPLPVLLEYARAASIPVEILIDDSHDLPKCLPVTASEWVMKDGSWRVRRT